ncbi:MAG TPA: BON domain-containing protein [Bryobacteraceae bacterium]|jgi:hyperosmotically inducible protein|nr:BON domain-containing protein [Bryobacteraceae bacterium]
MRIHACFPAAAAMAALLTFTPQSPAQNKDKKDNDHPMATHYDPYVTGAADNDVIRETRHRLLMLPYYGVFDDLGFTVNNGTVTLMGQVTRPTLKDDAASAVKKVPGVTNVVNNIEVLPLSPSDDRARIAVYRAIYGDSALSSRYAYRAAPAIHIIVKNGHVRLEGVVANQMDKQIAGMRAKGVSGIFSVDNELRIEGKG